jgi:hypothetical protein
MDEQNQIEEQERVLHALIVALRKVPHGSVEWQRSLSRLLLLIQGFPEFRKYTRSGYPPHYLDALNRTWEWLSREICHFQPRANSSIRLDLVRWVNGYLYWRVRDLAKSSVCEWHSLDETLYSESSTTSSTVLERLSDQGYLSPSTPTLDGLDRYLQQCEIESVQRCVNQIENYIIQDPDSRLRKCHPRNHPNCHAQLLGQRRCLKDPPDSLAEIARELDVHYQTLISHWKLKVVPLLQEIAIELGYEAH